MAVKTTSFELDVKPENIGAFIGKSGKNFKKFISYIKKDIIGKKTEITPEEWSSVELDLKFEKKEENIEAIFDCKEENIEKVKKSLLHFVELHNKENKKYENKKNNGQNIVYRIGAEHRFIGKMIGIGGSNVNKLKDEILKIENVESIKKINIVEQTKRYNGNFRNIGDRDSTEYIMMFITIKGSFEYTELQNIVEKFVDENTNEDFI